jgi:ribosomal protein L2
VNESALDEKRKRKGERERRGEERRGKKKGEKKVTYRYLDPPLSKEEVYGPVVRPEYHFLFA